jgi:hypothetical protein
VAGVAVASVAVEQPESERIVLNRVDVHEDERPKVELDWFLFLVGTHQRTNVLSVFAGVHQVQPIS